MFSKGIFLEESPWAKTFEEAPEKLSIRWRFDGVMDTLKPIKEALSNWDVAGCKIDWRCFLFVRHCWSLCQDVNKWKAFLKKILFCVCEREQILKRSLPTSFFGWSIDLILFGLTPGLEKKHFIMSYDKLQRNREKKLNKEDQ